MNTLKRFIGRVLEPEVFVPGVCMCIVVFFVMLFVFVLTDMAAYSQDELHQGQEEPQVLAPHYEAARKSWSILGNNQK